MRDTTALEQCVMETMLNKCFNTIVCEAFMGALPIDDKDMTKGLRRGLVEYAAESLGDAGGYQILQRAIKNTSRKDDPMAYAYLKEIESVCMEAATTVTERVVDEVSKTDDEDAIAQAATNVTMTPDEYSEFTKGASKVATDELENVIKEKVIDTIKDEKEAYQKDVELETEIKDAVSTVTPAAKSPEEAAKTPDELDTDTGTNDLENELDAAAQADEAFTTYMRSTCGHNFKHQHQTVFSRLQELALESVLATTEKYPDGVPVKTMGLITRRKTFPIFESANSRNPILALESVCRLATESLATPDSPNPNIEDTNPQETALITAAIIYTFFETLNTMHLYCPGLDEIRKFVDDTLPMSNMVMKDKQMFLEDLKNLVARAMDCARKASAMPELDNVEREMDAVREACAKTASLESYMPMIDSKFQTVKTLIENKRKVMKEKARFVPAQESEMDMQRRVADTMKFSSTASSYGRKHNVHKFRFKVDPQGSDMMRRYVAMECYDGRGNRVNNQTIVLEKAVESQKLASYVESAIRGSKMMELDKPITITDARNGKVYVTI